MTTGRDPSAPPVCTLFGELVTLQKRVRKKRSRAFSSANLGGGRRRQKLCIIVNLGWLAQGAKKKYCNVIDYEVRGAKMLYCRHLGRSEAPKCCTVIKLGRSEAPTYCTVIDLGGPRRQALYSRQCWDVASRGRQPTESRQATIGVTLVDQINHAGRPEINMEAESSMGARGAEVLSCH